MNSGLLLRAERYSTMGYWNSWIDCQRHMFGHAGVASVASSASVQLRLPLPPWPACTNQSRPHGVSCLSVAFLTSFCIEIEPSEQVVWLWKSPAAYVPVGSAAGAMRGAE